MNWQSFKTYGALTLVSLLYGVNYSVLKIIIPDHIGAFGFIVFRITISVLIFWMVNILFLEKIDWKADGFRLFLCGLTGIAINQLLFYKGLSLTSAVNGSIIMTLTPILVLIWARFLIGESVTLRKVSGIILGLIGAIVIIYQPNSVAQSGDWRGDILVFMNGFSYACYLVLVKPLMSKYKSITVVTWVFTFGLFIALPIGWNEAIIVDFSILPVKVWWSAAFAIIGVTVVVYFLNIWTLKTVNASVVGFFIYLQPIFATATALLFFEEVFVIKHLIASLFIFTGVFLVTKKPRD